MTVLRETRIFPSVLFLILKIISYNHPPLPQTFMKSPKPFGCSWPLRPCGHRDFRKNFKVFKTLRRKAQIWSTSYDLGEKSPQARGCEAGTVWAPCSLWTQALASGSKRQLYALPSGLDPSQPTGMTFLSGEMRSTEGTGVGTGEKQEQPKKYDLLWCYLQIKRINKNMDI